MTIILQICQSYHSFNCRSSVDLIVRPIKFTASCFFIACTTMLMAIPPPPVKLEERVQNATHVFVGVAERMRVIDGDTGKEISPEPKSLSTGHLVELEVRIVDVLKPTEWNPEANIIVRYQSGDFLVSDNRDTIIGHKLMYLTQQKNTYFVASYPWGLTKPEEKRAEIESLIKTEETKTYHETSIPRTLSEWKDSQDGKVSVCFAVDKTTFGTKEAITVRCAIRNLSDKPLTIRRPFGDPFYAFSAGLSILGPDGAIPYRGDMQEYVLGTSSFLELPAHTVVDETYVLPPDVFPGLGKSGLYTIGYQFMSDGYPKDPPPANFWRGQIKAATLTILVK